MMRITKTPLSEVQKTPPTGDALIELGESVCELADVTDSQIAEVEEAVCELATAMEPCVDLEQRLAALEAAVAAMNAGEEEI